MVGTSNPDLCPGCGSDLRGKPVLGRPGEWYSERIGVEIRGVYDGILYWACPRCGHRWHRWPEDHWLHARAMPYVDGRRPL